MTGLLRGVKADDRLAPAAVARWHALRCAAWEEAVPAKILRGYTNQNLNQLCAMPFRQFREA